MKFQVIIPPLTEDDFQMSVTVDGANWRTALRAAMKKIGESAELVKNIECDVQDDGTFQITDIDTRRVFTVKEVAEAAPAAAAAPAPDTQKQQEEARRVEEQKRREAEEAERLRLQSQEDARRAELRRDEERRREEEQRLLREQTIREEGQEAQRRAAAEAKRLEEQRSQDAQRARESEEQKKRLEESDKQQREEQRKKDESQKRAADEQRQKDDAAKKAEDQRKKDAAQRASAEEARKKEVAAAKITETQKLARPKVKGETIETRLGQKISGADTVEFLSDAFDALADLFSISSPQKAVDFVLEQALRKVPSEAGAVFFNDVGKRQLSFWAVRGPKSEKLVGKSIPYGKGIAGYCISKSVSLAIPDVSHDPRWDPAMSESISFETRSVLCAPLYFEGRCYGALELLNRKSDSGFTRRELSVTNYLAEQLARWLHENGE